MQSSIAPCSNSANFQREYIHDRPKLWDRPSAPSASRMPGGVGDGELEHRFGEIPLPPRQSSGSIYVGTALRNEKARSGPATRAAKNPSSSSMFIALPPLHAIRKSLS